MNVTSHPHRRSQDLRALLVSHSNHLSLLPHARPHFSAPKKSGGSTKLPSLRRSASGGFDQRQMESSIDAMVASSLVSGRQTSGVLRTLFGLVPSLIGR